MRLDNVASRIINRYAFRILLTSRSYKRAADTTDNGVSWDTSLKLDTRNEISPTLSKKKRKKKENEKNTELNASHRLSVR